MNVYLIINLINGKQYVGAEREHNSEYFGSGKLIGEAIEKFGKQNFRKEILIDDKYIDNWEECLELESFCISSFNTLIPYGYNQKIYQWPPSIKACKKGGKIGGKIGGKTVGKIIGKKNLGNWIKENPEEAFRARSRGGKIAGKISGKKCKELGIGIFAPGIASEGGKKCKELGIGIFVPGISSKGGKVSGKRAIEERTGIFDLANEKKRGEWRSKGGKIGSKMKARILFEIDGLIQRTTLSTILKM